MQIVEYPGECPVEAHSAAIAIGNFDGVHKGHRSVIEQAKSLAHKHQKPSAVLTFEPHPLKVLRPAIAPFQITDRETRRHLLSDTGVDYLFVIKFDKILSELTAEAFIEQVLVGYFKASYIIVGEDFKFGKGREGNIALLSELGAKHGFTLSAVNMHGNQEHTYSSSHIRHLLQLGEVEEAAEILGRPYVIEGMVVVGDKRGREIGFPTANISLANVLHPRFGVYVVSAISPENGTTYTGVANLGIKPTFSGEMPVLETHLFDFPKQGSLYGQLLRVELKKFLRPEQKFSTIEELIDQIRRDCTEAKQYHEA